MCPFLSLPKGGNEAPRSKLRGITELKHSELPEIFPRLPLPLHIPFDGLPVCSLPYRGHRVSVGPKLPAPPYPFHRRVSAKDLPRRDALEYLHHSTWSYFRMRTAEQMEVILVRPDRFHFDRKPFRNFGSRLLDNHRHRRIQQRLPVFHRKDNVVVDLPRTVRSLSDCIVPLVRHTPEGTRKDCPRSKLRGNTSSMVKRYGRRDKHEMRAQQTNHHLQEVGTFGWYWRARCARQRASRSNCKLLHPK